MWWNRCTRFWQMWSQMWGCLSIHHYGIKWCLWIFSFFCLALILESFSYKRQVTFQMFCSMWFYCVYCEDWIWWNYLNCFIGCPIYGCVWMDVFKWLEISGVMHSKVEKHAHQYFGLNGEVKEFMKSLVWCGRRVRGLFGVRVLFRAFRVYVLLFGALMSLVPLLVTYFDFFTIYNHCFILWHTLYYKIIFILKLIIWLKINTYHVGTLVILKNIIPNVNINSIQPFVIFFFFIYL